MSEIITSLKAIRGAADEAIQLAQLGETADLFDRIDFMAEQILSTASIAMLRYILTTEHAASSYNQPVLVDTETNIAYGTADVLPDGTPAMQLYEKLSQSEDPKMSPHKAALLIQRYATEAIEGLRTQGATADTEHRLIDLRALACDIAKDLQPIQDESSDPG
ncbi:hypothetical protein ES703_37278 [subsurface metagenome]